MNGGVIHVGKTAIVMDERVAGGDRSASGPCNHENTRKHELGEVLAVLSQCEKQMRKVRSSCYTDSEAFSSKCGATLESITALVCRASEFHPRHGAKRESQDGVFADAEWFQDVASAISIASDLVSHSKAGLSEIKSRAHATAEQMRWEDAAAGEMQGEKGTEHDLLATMHSISMLGQSTDAFERAAEHPLRSCANEAGDWACASSAKLQSVLSAQDDALVQVAEHAAQCIERHGNSAMLQGDKLLQEGGEDRLSEALTCFLQAKSAYDEVYGIKVFAAQNSPELPFPDLANVSQTFVVITLDANFTSDLLAC